jgi:hypothetical protein
VEDINPQAPRWDRDQVTILIGRGLDHFTALKQVRAMLTWLGAPQLGIGALCWCGDHVTIPDCRARMPEQRTGPRLEQAKNA